MQMKMVLLKISDEEEQILATAAIIWISVTTFTLQHLKTVNTMILASDAVNNTSQIGEKKLYLHLAAYKIFCLLHLYRNFLIYKIFQRRSHTNQLVKFILDTSNVFIGYCQPA